MLRFPWTLALILFTCTVSPTYTQSGSGIEEITLEAWLIVGAIVFAAVGAVVITWFALIVRICRIYCSHRKSERKFNSRYQSRLERGYGRQPHVSDAELRAVSLRRTDYQVSPQGRRARQTQPLPRHVDPHTSAGLGKGRSPSSYSNYHGPKYSNDHAANYSTDYRAASSLNTSMNSSGMVQQPHLVSGSGMVRSSSNSSGVSMARLSSNATGAGRFSSNQSHVGMVRTNSNSSGVIPGSNSHHTYTGQSVSNPFSMTRSGSDSTSPEIVRSVANSSEPGPTQLSPSTSSGSGILKPPSSRLNGGSHTQQLSHSPTVNQPASSRARVVLGGSSRSQLQSLSEVEEMDVRQDVSEGLPRYSHLFPAIQELNEAPTDQRIERSTSPFTFSSERRVGGRESDRRLQFNQLSSWPNFK